jgi:hypothetical protein
VRFPYITLPKTSPRPYLEVALRNGCYTSEILLALVDSGADYTLFPMEVAEHYLKLDLTRNEVWTFSGTTGETQNARLAKVSMTFLKPGGMEHFHEVAVTTCAFCDTLKFPGGGLLGRNGFFTLFETIFDEPRKCFLLEPWPSVGA